MEIYLKKKGFSFPKSCDSLFPTVFTSELDVASEISVDDASHYQSLIRFLRHTVDIGIVYMCLEVSMMASCVALPRKFYLEMLHRVFAHFKKYHNTEMVFDPSKPSINNSDVERKD